LKGLQGAADDDHDNVVTLGELIAYAEIQTKNYVARTQSLLQRPYLSGALTAEVLRFDIGRILAPPLAMAPFDEKQAKADQGAWAKHHKSEITITNSLGMKLTLIPPGEFLMGSPETELGYQDKRKDDEKQHRVRLTKPFYLGMYEVTQEEYEKLIDK